MRLLMMGTGTFAEPTFEALLSDFPGEVVGLVTQPERDAGNKRGSTRQTGKGMANIAAARGVALIQPESINTPEGVAGLRELRPDLMVVAAYGQILSKEVLSVPAVGTINVHASLLPKYRGAAPVAYAILSGETRTGVTIIKVTPGLDSGDMILQDALDILADDTTGSLEARLADLGAKLAVEAVRKYQAGGPVEGKKQNPALVTKAPKIKKEFGLIDWSRPAEYIERFVRAMQPWPTAYTFFHRPGKDPMRIAITRCRVGQMLRCGQGQLPPAGGFHAGYDDCFSVYSGTNVVVDVFELQPAGKKRMTAVEFLRGNPVPRPLGQPTPVGYWFGPERLL
jgi:methionyl-tRNA formyltransferase